MKLWRMSLPVALISMALAQSHQEARTAKNPLSGRPEAIEAGKGLFREGCAGCHGGNGEGGRGPNLAESESLREKTDDQVFNTIRRGIPGTNMPAFAMPESQIWEVIAFIRALGTPAFLTPASGDAEAGRALFYGEGGCGSCHMIRGRGGFLGPDLTNIAALRTSTQLRDAILQPNARPLSGFEGVTVILKDGTRVEGVAKNNSNYSIQVLDAAGKLHLIDRAQASDVRFRGGSLMSDNYAHTLSPTGIENILAFLSKQVVRPDAQPANRRRERENR